jgi:hypothetical protein
MRNKFILLFVASLCLISNSNAQSKWYLGLNAATCASKTASADTLANNFTTRNRWGAAFNLGGYYEMNRVTSLHFGVGIINKGYKINNDTLSLDNSINSSITALNANFGLSFKQKFGGSMYIMEKIGGIINYNQSPSTVRDTFYNSTTKPSFRIIQTESNKWYPMIYLGFVMGGSNERGDRYEFNITYQQSLNTSHELQVQTGEFYSRTFPLNFRGGNLQIGISYYFNLGNIKKNEEYYY